MPPLPKLRMFPGICTRLKCPVPTRSVSSATNPEVNSNKSEPSRSTVSTEPRAPEPEESPVSYTKSWAERMDKVGQEARIPRNVQAIYLRPLRREAKYGLPVCDLQLRSYSVRNVEFFADFALRAAYYLNLPVSGPVPLPRIVERWTFPRSNFVHKKSQENFERITLRRLIQIKDGNIQTVQTWLAFLRKHAFYGVGMKANIWEHESLDVAKTMDKTVPEIEGLLGPQLSQFGQRKGKDDSQSLFDILDNERFTKNKGPLTEVRGG